MHVSGQFFFRDLIFLTEFFFGPPKGDDFCKGPMGRTGYFREI